LFGDTFIGEPGAPNRIHAKMIDNSVAVTSCDDGRWNVDYAWRKTANAAAPFFSSARSGEKYWPLSGVMNAGTAYVVLVRVRTVPGGTPFSFKLVGADVAKLTPTMGDPSGWNLEIEPLYDGEEWIIGAAATKVERDILLLSAAQIPDPSGHAMALMRLTHDGGKFHLEGQDTTGNWRKFPEHAPQRLFAQGSSEASLTHDSAQNLWSAVHTEGGFAKPNVVHRSAEHLAGPWTQPRAIYRFPEMTPGDARYVPNVFCYAAKAHEELSNASESVVTYACNAQDERVLRENMSIYRPRFEKIDIR
jgi:hypothetical protein